MPAREGSGRKRIDLTGQRFGEWTVRKICERVPGHTGAVKWWVLCTCGYVGVVDSQQLRRGKSRSCRSCAQKRRWATNDLDQHEQP